VTARWTLEGRLELGVCLDICMPVTLDLNGELLPDGERDRDIGLALSDRPLTGGGGRRRNGALRRGTDFRRPARDGDGDVPATGNDETLVLEHRDPQIWVSEATTRGRAGPSPASRTCVPSDHGPFALNRSDLRVTVIGTQMAVELDGCRG
jgi:hypothetical protein